MHIVINIRNRLAFLNRLIQIPGVFFVRLAHWTEICYTTRSRLSKRQIFQNVFYPFKLSVRFLRSDLHQIRQ